MSVRKLTPDQAVRVEVSGHIVKQIDDNPYFYEVSFDEPGRPNELVSLARISAVNERFAWHSMLTAQAKSSIQDCRPSVF
ncbi:MAG: hypothetical protein NVSMB27_08010 [Ktedonobacteraceae bacterium]